MLDQPKSHEAALILAAHISATEARQGVMVGPMRYVLAGSVALGVIALIAVFVFV